MYVCIECTSIAEVFAEQSALEKDSIYYFNVIVVKRGCHMLNDAINA